MGALNFSMERVRSLECPPGKTQAFFRDPKTPGLGIRVTRNKRTGDQARAYIFEGRVHGRTLRLTIGSVLSWSLKAAQTEATRLRVLTDQGFDPRELKASAKENAQRIRKERQRAQITLNDAWQDYTATRGPFWSENHRSAHKRAASMGGELKKRGAGSTKPGPLAALLPLKLCELTPDRMAGWLRSESQLRPTSVALSFRMLKTCVSWCEEQEKYSSLIPKTTFTASAVCDAVPKAHAKEGDCLQKEQLGKWFNAVLNLENPVMGAYLQALLLTGARRREMAHLRWVNVDFEWRRITLTPSRQAGLNLSQNPRLRKRLFELT